jgi:hypothetical protein
MRTYMGMRVGRSPFFLGVRLGMPHLHGFAIVVGFATAIIAGLGGWTTLSWSLALTFCCVAMLVHALAVLRSWRTS